MGSIGADSVEEGFVLMTHIENVFQLRRRLLIR